MPFRSGRDFGERGGMDDWIIKLCRRSLPKCDMVRDFDAGVIDAIFAAGGYYFGGQRGGVTREFLESLGVDADDSVGAPPRGE